MKNYIQRNIILFITILGVISCNSHKQADKENEDRNNHEDLVEVTTTQFESANMELGKLTKQEFSESVKTNGFIDVPPGNKAKVSAIMGGFVKNSPLLVGDRIKKGQLLLTIENQEFIELQQNYLEISEKLKYLKSESERQKVLYEEKIASQKNFLKAESDYKSALALHSGLTQKLKLLHIDPKDVLTGNITSTAKVYSPISGSVTEVYANVGEYKNTSDVLMEIINNDHCHLELAVFEKDVLKIEAGQRIHFKIPESSATIFEANVYLVGKAIDEHRTVKVHGHLKNEDESLLVGMFVEAEIVTGTKQTYALPVNAVLEEEDAFYVLVLKEKHAGGYTFEKLQVSVGEIYKEWIEINIEESDLINKEIVIQGAFLPLG